MKQRLDPPTIPRGKRRLDHAPQACRFAISLTSARPSAHHLKVSNHELRPAAETVAPPAHAPHTCTYTTVRPSPDRPWPSLDHPQSRPPQTLITRRPCGHSGEPRLVFPLRPAELRPNYRASGSVWAYSSRRRMRWPCKGNGTPERTRRAVWSIGTTQKGVSRACRSPGRCGVVSRTISAVVTVMGMILLNVAET